MGLWSTIKSGVKKFGKGISNIGSAIKSGVKQGAKWAWDNREGIGKAIGAGLDVASTLGVPGAGIASQVVKGIANVSKAAGDDKFSNGLKATMKKDKGITNDNNSSSNNNTQPTTSSGYSINVKGSGGTKHSRIYSWVR